MIFALLLSAAATLGSVVNLTKIATTTHSPLAPKSLSERATLGVLLLTHFRTTLLVCSSLFAASIYFFIAPSASLQWWIIGAWTLEYVGVIIAAMLPAKGKTFHLHLAGAQAMGSGMLLLAFAFWKNYTGAGSAVELVIGITMLILAFGTYLDKRRFIFHELGFIYLSHISIVVAALLLK
ncbi:MAG TPA: hypothetical protein VJP80_02525 [Candidatus Saccharimonadales bacterium]|nr:hypothetical protein [Candidatus Saccharimonadales bacterium]